DGKHGNDHAEASGSSSPPGCRHDCVVLGFGPSDLEVVVLGVTQIGRAAGKEFGVNGLLGHSSTGPAHLICQSIDLVRSVDQYADGEADAFGGRCRFGVPITGELGNRKQRKHNAAKLEGRKPVLIDKLLPAEAAIEV